MKKLTSTTGKQFGGYTSLRPIFRGMAGSFDSDILGQEECCSIELNERHRLDQPFIRGVELRNAECAFCALNDHIGGIGYEVATGFKYLLRGIEGKGRTAA